MSLSPNSTSLTPASVLKNLSEIGITRTYKAGEVIIQELARVQSIPFIKSGSIKVLKSDDDYKEILLYYLTAGETCVMSFLAGLNNDTSKIKAVAEEDCEIIFVPLEAITHLIREQPQWLFYFFQIYHKRFEELLEVVNDIAFKKMDERLLSLLKQRAEVAQSNTLTITHEELARQLGTAREVVSRLLKQMERSSLVALSRNRVTLM